MFGFLKSEKKETSESKTAQLFEKIKTNRYFDQCIEQCFTNYTEYLIEEEKVCLAQCSDNFSRIFNKHSELLVKAKSFIN